MVTEKNQINLRKDLVKEVATSQGIASQKAQVVLVLDYSVYITQDLFNALLNV